MEKALIIKEKWINLILEGDSNGLKELEIRGCNTNIRGRVGLIKSGSGLIVGSVEIIGSEFISEENFNNSKTLHKINCKYEELPYQKPHAWHMKNPIKFKTPIPYKHPQGAVIWVDLTKCL